MWLDDIVWGDTAFPGPSILTYTSTLSVTQAQDMSTFTKTAQKIMQP
jgi:hypothetical protein